MKPTDKIILAIGLTIFIFSCSSNKQEEMESKDYSASRQEESLADSISGNANTTENTINGFIFSSAAVETGNDTTRKFIRTAEIKFRVKNVAQTTYQIEDMTAHFEGFVINTDLESEINRRTTTALSADSSLETIYYTVTNTMTVRVPNVKLDTTLKSIAKLIDYLDYRIINARDVALEILSNKMKQERMKMTETQSTTTVESGGKNVVKSQHTQESPLYKQAVSDEAKLANMSMDDQIKFSTITLSIYQREETKRWVIPNDKNIDAYKPIFWTQLIEAFKYGWGILVAFITFLVKLWGIFLFGIIVYVLYKMYGHKLKIKPRQ